MAGWSEGTVLYGTPTHVKRWRNVWTVSPRSLEPKWRRMLLVVCVLLLSLFPKLLCTFAVGLLLFKPLRPASVSLGVLA